MFNSYRVDKNEFLTAGSGDWNQLARTRQQMPVVGVEIVPTRKYNGYQLGGGHMVQQDVLFYIMATNRDDRNNWVDRISNQNNVTIWTINRKTSKASASWPFDYDYRGEIVSSPTQYPDLVAATGLGGFRWKTATFTNCRLQDMQNINDWLYTSHHEYVDQKKLRLIDEESLIDFDEYKEDLGFYIKELEDMEYEF